MYFDVDAHKGCFKTNPDEAYFWHGRTNGCGGQDVAMDIASENGGKTLEMCMLDHRDELEEAGVRFRDNDDGTVSIDFGNSREESKQFWEDCSKAFAEQSSGNIHVIEGADPRPNGQAESDYPSVYNRIEHPALEQNQSVNSITHIDPSTRQQTGVESFKRHGESSSGEGSPSLQSSLKEDQPAGPNLADIDPPRNPQSLDTSIPAGPQNKADFAQFPATDLTKNTAQGADNLAALPTADGAQNAAKSVTGGIT